MDVNSVNRADQIIELVGMSRKGLNHKDIHQALSLPKSSLTRLLSTLVRLQYLAFDSEPKKYFLGARCLILAGRFLSGLDVFQIGQAFMDRLSKLTGESATLAIPADGEVILIAIENVPQAILSPPHVGDRLPLYATAAGKAILANMSDSEIDRYLEQTELIPITAHTMVDKDEIRSQLREIRQGGFAYSHEEFREYVVAVGLPVLDVNGRAVASLSLSLLSLHATPEKRISVESALRAVVADFSHRLGYGGRSEKSSANPLT